MMNLKALLLILISTNCSFANNSTSKNESGFVKKIHVFNNRNYASDTTLKPKEIKQIEYYRTQMFQVDKKIRCIYADSLLMIALKTKNNSIISKAYLSRGILFYNQKQLQSALDNYLLADKYSVQTQDQYTTYKIKYAIAQTKYYLGLYDEAIALFRECVAYFEEENDRAYLNSIHALGLCYNRIGKTDSCSYYNALGIKLSKELNDSKMIPYFNHSEGVNLFSKKKYKQSITTLNEVMPNMGSDFANKSVAYFYIGKSYWLLSQKEKAITYLKKIDTIFEKEKYTRPDLRESYELLIDYYKKNGDTKLQLYYINQLLKVDHLLGQNYKYLLRKIVKEYDTKELLKSKNNIEKAMVFRTIVGVSIISILVIIISYLIYKHFKNKRLFEEIMKRDTSLLTKSNYYNQQECNESSIENENLCNVENSNKQSAPEISPEIETGILKKLEKFEQNKKYLEKDMTLSKMATLLNTNTKYVTKIIAKHRGKGTIDYITDLKIDYIIERLKTDSKFRNYTNKALGEEAGFGSTQNFTRAFKVRNGISPTYFINQLKNL